MPLFLFPYYGTERVLGVLPESECSVLRRDLQASGFRRLGLDTGLSAYASSRHVTEADAQSSHRIFPSHSVSLIRIIPYIARAGGIVERSDGSGFYRFPYTRLYALFYQCCRACITYEVRFGRSPDGQPYRACKRTADGHKLWIIQSFVCHAESVERDREKTYSFPQPQVVAVRRPFGL